MTDAPAPNGAPSSPRAGLPPGALPQFFSGVGDVWRGAHWLLAHPGLWWLALVPFVLNLLLFAAGAWAGWHFFGGWISAQFMGETDGFWMQMLGFVLVAVFWLLYIIAVVFLFVPIATLVALPFNDLLSEKVERVYAGRGVEGAFAPGALLKALMVGFRSSLRLTLKTIVLILFALSLNLIPVIGHALYVGFSSWVTISFLALQFTTYSMDRRFYTYVQRERFRKRFRPRTLGLGAMAFGLMLIPVINALFIPVSAVAGTLLFCDTELAEQPE